MKLMKQKLQRVVDKSTGPMLLAVIVAFIVSLVFTFTKRTLMDMIFTVCLGIEVIIIAMMYVAEVLYDRRKQKKKKDNK